MVDIKDIRKKAEQWLSSDFDEATRLEVKSMLDNDEKALIDAFYQDLEFGTGGLRGVMGAGTNRMNRFTVQKAAIGFALYLLEVFKNAREFGVVISHDNRHMSREFTMQIAEILSKKGLKTYIFDALRPTPELSFAVRYLHACGGVMITASHNPKEYNGYKVYWDDGGQLVNPHDINVIKEVQKIKSVDEVKISAIKENIEIIGEQIDAVYLKQIKSLSLHPDINKKFEELKIVYTPIHGSGVHLVPKALDLYGFKNVNCVDEQCVIDGNFPTVKSPNPEEPAALELALKKAKEIDADILLGTDPDADRVGIAVKDLNGKFVLLNGNQTATILIYYLLNAYKEKKLYKGNEFIVKTIVTSELLNKIAYSFNVESIDVLTGFKFIAEVILKNEGSKKFIGGGEESYGYLIGDFVRDKDAVVSCCIIAEAAAWALSKGKSMFQLLIDIYMQYGFYKESLLSITKKGKDGADEIKQMMINYRNNPPKQINGQEVIKIKDYLLQVENNFQSNNQNIIHLPKSDVIQFFLYDGTIITVRPSGTEPKIKFYFGVKTEIKNINEFDEANRLVDQKLNAIIVSMNLK